MTQTLHITAKTDDIHPKELEYLSDYLGKLLTKYSYSEISIDVTTVKNPIDLIWDAIYDVLDIGILKCLSRNRERVVVYARVIFTKFGTDRNWTDLEIQKLLNHTRNDVYYYKRIYDQMYAYDPQFREYANRVNEITKGQ